MSKSLREDIVEKFDEKKYGEIQIEDVVSYESPTSPINNIISPITQRFRKSKSYSDLYKYFHTKRPPTQFITTVDTSKSPYYFILNSMYECCQCTNKINILDYKISITCPLCFACYHKPLKNFIYKIS